MESDKRESPALDIRNAELSKELLSHRKQSKCKTCEKKWNCYGTRYCQRVFRPLRY